MPQFPPWTVGLGVSAALLASMVPNIVTKTATTSIASNVTLANDSELVNIALGVGTWEIETMYLATGAAGGTSNLKAGWTFSGTVTGSPVKTTLGPASSSTASPIATTISNWGVTPWNVAGGTIYGLGSATVFATCIEICNSFTVSVAGNLNIQFAQGTSLATATVIQPGSRVKVRQIG